MTRATILIPAHNEAAVIDRTLLHLSRGLSLDDFRIVVIANACSDATAGKARAAMPQATIIETEKAGKCHALNLGYEVADKTGPIICLDADLDVTAESLMALIAPLEAGEALASCGRMNVVTTGATALVRAYYTGWRTNPYFDNGKFGGLFALSAGGASRVFPLPEITGDDEYIRRSFSEAEKAFAKTCHFAARAPRSLTSLIRVRRRSLRGARELTRNGLSSPERSSMAIVLGRLLRRPTTVVPVSVYLVVNLWVRLPFGRKAKGRAVTWERDLTTRVA